MKVWLIPFVFVSIISVGTECNSQNQPSLYSGKQLKKVEIPIDKTGDTDLFYNLYGRYRQKIGLKDLIKSNDSFHFRFWCENEVVDIWTTDNKIFHGAYADFTTNDFEHFYNLPLKNIFFDTIVLDSATSKYIYDNCWKLSIFSIPKQDSIKGWMNGDDGEEFAIEYSTPVYYYFRTYWTPRVFKKKIKEAAEIDSLNTILSKELDTEQRLNTFLFNLPNGRYRVGEMLVFDKRNAKKRHRTKPAGTTQ